MSAAVKVSRALQAIAAGLEDVLRETGGERMGFVLLVGTLNREPTELSYVANIARDDAKKLLRDFLDRSGPDTPFHARH